MKTLISVLILAVAAAPCAAKMVILEGGSDQPISIQAVPKNPDAAGPTAFAAVKLDAEPNGIVLTDGFYYNLGDDEVDSSVSFVAETPIGGSVYLVSHELYLENKTDYKLHDVGLVIPFFLDYFLPVGFSYDNSDHTWRLSGWWGKTYGVQDQNTLVSMDRTVTDVPLSTDHERAHMSVAETDEVTFISFGDLLPGEGAYRQVHYHKNYSGFFGWIGFAVSKNPHAATGATALEITGPNTVRANSWINYMAIAYYDDAPPRDVTASARWWVQPEGLADIYGSSLLTPDMNESRQITMYAEYIEASGVLQAQMPITIHPQEEDALLRVPSEYPTIQAAIDAAEDGDAVVISPGTYTGPGNRDLDFRGKAITVRSENPADPEVVAATIIDCNGSESDQHRGFVLTENEGPNSLLAGLTITNGYAHTGAGINCGATSPTVAKCIFRANTAQHQGGGAYTGSRRSSPVFSNCTFVENRALDGDGGGVCYETADSPIMFDCTFLGNSAAGGGGALAYSRALFGSAVLADCIFNGNSASNGGALADYDRRGRGTLDAIDCRFTHNSAARDGGAITNTGGLGLTNCLFTDNTSAEAGGAICNEGGLGLTNCLLRQNSAGQNGGATCNRYGQLDSVDCTFQANSANRAGGAIANYPGSATLTNCLLTENSAGLHGGGIANDAGDVHLLNCTFSSNRAPAGRALSWEPDYIYGATCLRITNCILWDGGDEIWRDSVWGREYCKLLVTYSNVQGAGWSDYGNIDSDPCFAFLLDPHLMPDSPCVDTATNTPYAGLPPTDLDDNSRPLDGDGDETATADMGVYEYNPNSLSIAVSSRIVRFTKGRTECTQTLGIRNCGAGTLNWQIIADCNWLEVTPTSGVSAGDVNQVNLTADCNNLAHGRHKCILAVTDPDAANNPVTINVSFYVPGTRRVPAEYETIQAAIDAAGPFDTVIIAPGIYTGDGNRDLDFRGKPITVRSIDPNDPNIVATTIIDCNGTCEYPHRGFYFHSDEDANSVVEGLTIINGVAVSTQPWPPLPVWPKWMERLFPLFPCVGEGAGDSTHDNSAGIDGTGWFQTPEGCGGAILCEGPSFSEPGPGPTIRNCTITGNISMVDGGAIYGSSGPVINCTIRHNRSGWYGGAMAFCAAPIVDCVIKNNRALIGGGLSDCNSVVSNCIIVGNRAVYGGGIANHYGRVINCTIADNRGGGMAVARLYPEDPPLPWEPWAARSYGGAASVASEDLNSPPQIINCVIWGSYAGAYSGMYGYTAAYSDIQQGWPGEGNINSDPCFIAHGYWALVTDPNVQVEPYDPNAVWVDGDYHLLRTSPCIDAGDNNSIAPDAADLDGDANTAEPTPFDFEGRPRIVDGIPDGIPIVDMGVYETVTEPRTHYVDGDANGADNGSSWEDAFKYLQDAPAAAIYGDQIRVAEGTYTPDESRAHPDGTGERTATFQLKNAVIIRGGYAGAQAPDPNARDFNSYETVLSGDLNGDDTPGFANNAENSYHVVSANSVRQRTALEGLTITAGNANVRRFYDKGGGIYNLNASPTVVNCRVAGNWAWAGAGAANIGGKAAFINCSFNGNAASGGGGLFNKSSTVSLMNCIFVGNSAAGGGGLSSTGQTTPTVTNCIFRANRNKSSGMMDEPDQILATSVSVNHCCVQGWTGGLAGVGNTGQDPCFVEPGFWDSNGLWADGDYHLSPPSPCIDAADNTSLPADLTDLDGDGNSTEVIPFDLDGKARRTGSAVDIGAYEFPNTPPVAVAGSDQTAYARSDGKADVSLDGSASHDDDGDKLNFRWSWSVDGQTMTATGAAPVIKLPPGTHVIELIVNDGIIDCEPDTLVVTVVPPVECKLKLTPRKLNLSSKGKWVKAHFTLPRGLTAADVDTDSPVTIEPLTIESSYIRLIGNRRGRKLRVGFDRAAFCRVTSFGPAEVTVTGRLISGQYFYGTAAITLISHTLNHLADFASYWLRADCAGPDWCNNYDRDRDSTVNFEDFTMLDRCTVEIFAP